jgi:RimJ/RimL family protein N-acetyltransferase
MNLDHKSKVEVTFRPIVADDVNSFRILRLKGLQLYPEAFGESASSFEQSTIQQIEERIVKSSSHGGIILGAFVQTNKLVGIAAVSRTDSPKMLHRGHVWGVIVDPEVHGQKVGHRLMSEIVDWARLQPHLEQLDLSVTTNNLAAIALYESVGFIKYGVDPRRIRVDAHYFDEYLMILDLRTT